MPKDGPGKQMAPVPAYPVPTAADQLPVGKIKLPPGFKAEVWASGILDARGMRQGDNGTVFVSSLFVAGKIYAIQDKGGKREVKTIAEKLFLPNGIEFHKGALYVATPKDITRYEDNIEANLDNPPKPVMVYDKLPGLVPHGWKFIKIGPDGKLYVPTGAPCNICEDKEGFAQIARMNLDGTGMEVVARGVRNTVGFDFHPKTGELWFTNNGRDWLSEDLPNDTLNRVGKPGKDHFGYPFCHQGNFADPEFGWGQDLQRVHPAGRPHRPARRHPGHALLHRQDVSAEVPERHLPGSPRPVESQQEICGRHHGGLPRWQGRRFQDGTVHDRPGRKQRLPRPSGRCHGDEGWLDARLRRPQRSDLSHQLQGQVRAPRQPCCLP